MLAPLPRGLAPPPDGNPRPAPVRGLANSTIYKAAVHRSAGCRNDLRDPFQPLVPLTASGMEWWNDGIVPIYSTGAERI